MIDAVLGILAVHFAESAQNQFEASESIRGSVVEIESTSVIQQKELPKD